jgi:predicted Zn-dependent protease
MTYYGDDIPCQILLMEETGVPGENHRPAANHRQTLSHNVVSSTLRHERGSNSQ